MAYDILIVDDEQDIRSIITDLLQDEGYETRSACDGQSSLEAVKQRCPSLVILDIWLGDSRFDGLKVLENLKETHPDLPVIMMSGHGNIETAVKAIKLGAYDFVEKPFKSDRLLLVIQRAIEAARLARENLELKSKFQNFELVGQSSFISQIRSTIQKISPTNSRVFIKAPPGCGKETVAREIHNHSHRFPHGKFLTFNCAAIPPDQLEQELFGVDSDAAPDKVQITGILERAHKGTLLLQEVLEMPLSLQGNLARFLQEGAFCRIGGQQKVQVDVRILTSSCKDVLPALEAKAFREDLFYRLNVVPMTLKPLKDRKEDIPLLAQHFLGKASADGCSLHGISSEAIATLQAYNWPGNIRQFQNVMESILIMNGNKETKESLESGTITTEMLPAEVKSSIPLPENIFHKQDVLRLPLREARNVFEKQYLSSQVSRFSGNVSHTADFIGMERSALHRKLRALGIVRDRSEC